MGKWAQYQKRGSSKGIGLIAAPLVSDFSMTSITQTTANVTRGVSAPGGADGFVGQVQLQTGGAIVSTGPVTTGFNCPVGAMTANTPYRARISWYLGTRQVSDWSPWLNFNTIP